MGIKKDWFFPRVSAIYCYRVLLLFLFLLSLPLIDRLEILSSVKIAVWLVILFALDFLARKLVVSKLSAALLYLFSVILSSVIAGVTSASLLLNTTELSFFNLLKSYFAFVNFLSAMPDILVLIMILGGGLLSTFVFEKNV